MRTDGGPGAHRPIQSGHTDRVESCRRPTANGTQEELFIFEFTRGAGCLPCLVVVSAHAGMLVRATGWYVAWHKNVQLAPLILARHMTAYTWAVLALFVGIAVAWCNSSGAERARVQQETGITRRGNGRVRTDYGLLGCGGASAFIDRILVHSAMSRRDSRHSSMYETRVCNERWGIMAADARNT